MITQDDVEKMLDAAKPSVIESLKKDLTQMVSYEMKEQATKVIREHTEKWVKENILPAITAELLESKEGMIGIGKALAPAMVQACVSAIQLSINEKLKNSWERKKLFEALLG